MNNLSIIVDYILGTVNDIHMLTLQRLLFYVQGFYLGMYGKSLFDEDFYAGYITPAIPELMKDSRYQCEKGTTTLHPYSTTWEQTYKETYTQEEQAFIGEIVDVYSVFSDHDLGNIVLHEECYRVVKPLTASHPRCIIEKESMRVHFMMKIVEHHIREEKYSGGADVLLRVMSDHNIHMY